jgi:imidazolonepropionase-like amidohydrolase
MLGPMPGRPRRRSARTLGVFAGAALSSLLLAALAGAAWLRSGGLAVPEPGVALAGLTVVNPGESREPGRGIEVRGDRITRVSASPLPGASDAYAGSFALPGLVDLHVHHPPALALGQRELFDLLFLAHGVTSVRDTGSFDGRLFAYRRRIDAGEHPGPRIFACGAILDGDPPAWPGARRVHDAAEAQQAVARLAAEGADCVKVYNQLDEASFIAIREAAAARGLPVVAHVPEQVPFERVAGVEVQHLMGLTEDWAALGERDVDRYVFHSLRFDLVHTPTLVVFARAALLDRADSLGADPAARLLPRFYRELLWNPAANPLVFWLTPGGWGEVGLRAAAMQRVVRRLHESGVRILAGTDTLNPYVVPGASLQAELVQLAEAGLGLEGAWIAATRHAGEALGVPGLGRVAEGAPADLAIYGEDPSRDAAAFATLRAVIVRGRLYPREDLVAAAARRRERLDGWLPSTLFRAAARLVISAVARGD